MACPFYTSVCPLPPPPSTTSQSQPITTNQSQPITVLDTSQSQPITVLDVFYSDELVLQLISTVLH